MRTAMVVAHPDDEILWFSSVLTSMDAIYFCFEEVPSRPAWTAGRRAAVAAYPLPHLESLRLVESEAFDAADWTNPVCTEYGLEVRRRAHTLPGMNGRTYHQNYTELLASLRPRLQNCARVYTHNPWGEYGHEEHVQVYRAVKALQPALGFEIWFSNYCSNKSHRLMLRYVGGFQSDYETRETNSALSAQLRTLYQEHGCWTWFNDYRGFTHECFMPDRALKSETPAGHFFPLNFIKVAEPPPEPSVAVRAAATVRTALASIRR